ncbi:MAG: RluA family pseudouridine synthase [Candidatus Humimicrobiaceae bacterium]
MSKIKIFILNQMEKENKNLIFYPESSDKGLRIDKFLSNKELNISRSKLQKLISLGKVRSYGEIISKNYILRGFEKIEIEDMQIPVSNINARAQDIRIKIIFEDEYILAVSKAAGMVVHPAPGHFEGTLINALMNYDERLSGVGGGLRAGIVHRLDKDTSGIILVAKDDRTHMLLSDKFKNREIKKSYEALVLGYFKEPQGTINLPVGRSMKDRKKMGVVLRGRQSQTDFKVVDEYRDTTLIEAYPKTGRTHQIRVHFSYIGHPIIGDKDYGNKESDRIAKETGLTRQFLHSKRIIFSHPVTNEVMDLNDELPRDLKNCLTNLKKNI